MSTPHTPGPWQIGGSLVSANGTEIAMVMHRTPAAQRSGPTCDQSRDAPELPEADANGRVIIAAPTLLAFVRKVAGNTYAETREHAHSVTDEARYLLARIERERITT